MALSQEQIIRLILQYVPDAARRAVATQTVRLGTVDTTQELGNPNVDVVVDGDLLPSSMLNASGELVVEGQRVVVLYYPPHGVLVIGALATAAEEVESVRYVGEAGNPAFENGWANFGSGFANVGFYKDPSGVVHLQGMIAGGSTNARMFLLPAGYRPSESLRFAVLNNGSIALVQVFDDGTVRLTATGPNSNVWVNLSGICFLADPGNLREPEWIYDSKVPGSTLDWLSSISPQPGIWSRDDGLHIYRGRVGANSANAVQGFRLYPFEMQPRFSRMFSLLVYTAGTTTTHGSRRVDLDNGGGSYVALQQTGAYTAVLDGIHWFDKRFNNDFVDLSSTYANGWQAYPVATGDLKWGPARAYKDRYGQVWLTGLNRPGVTTSNTTIVTLPPGYRPADREMFSARTTNGAGRVDVWPGGEVRVAASTDGVGATFLSFDQITFRAA